MTAGRRHKKVIDMLDEQGFKPLCVLKGDLGIAKLNWFTYFRLKTTLEKFSNRNPGLSLTSKEVKSPSDKTGKTPLDYILYASKLFKLIHKGSTYYRRILLLHKPKDTTNYKTKMEKRLGVNLKQSYVNRITAMLNSGMIPPGNSDIIRRFLLGKTRPGDEIWALKNQSWDGYCMQCCKVDETVSHIFKCVKTREYLDKLSINVEIQRVYGVKRLLGDSDQYLWSD